MLKEASSLLRLGLAIPRRRSVERASCRIGHAAASVDAPAAMSCRQFRPMVVSQWTPPFKEGEVSALHLCRVTRFVTNQFH